MILCLFEMYAMLSFCGCCLHGEFVKFSHFTGGWIVSFLLDLSLLFSLPPEGLKKVRNPDRMYRSAVCYAGHGPPKSISDDTETNSKSQLLIQHSCSEKPVAGQSIIHSSIHVFSSWFHPSPCPHAPPSPPCFVLQHNTSCGCSVDWSVCFTGSRCQ